MATSGADHLDPQVDIRVGRPGAALVQVVSAALRDLQDGDPLRLVRIVAPDSATVDGLRRSLPRCGGACGAEIGGTLRLASTVASPRLGGRRPAPPVAVLATVQRVLADTATRPATFASCADHPATHDAVVRAFATLNGVFTLDGDHRAMLAGLAGPRASASAVCAVVAQARTQLLAHGLLDAAEVVRIATEVLDEPAGPVQPPVVIVVTQQFNPAHVLFLRALVRRSARTIVVASSSRHGEPSVADHVSRIIGHAVEVPHHPVTSGVTPVVVSCPDHDEEVREVTRRIVTLLDAGVAADRIAVFYPPAGPYRATIASALSAAGIPARGQVSPALRGSIAGQVLRLLAALATDGLNRRRLIQLARLAPFGLEVGVGGQVRTVARRSDQWNRVAQRHGIVGEHDWPRFEALELEAGTAAARRHRELVGFVRTQRWHRDAVGAAGSWAELAAALEAWFSSHCGTLDWRLGTWKGVANWQLDAAEQVEGLFTLLAQLDRFGLARSTRAAARLIDAYLDDDVISAESKGAGVVVDQIVGASGAVFDHAFVLGANDAILPGRGVDDLVLHRALGPEPLGVLTGPANRPVRDRRGWFAALDGATHGVTVTLSRWDVRAGGALYPSPLLPTGHQAQHVASHAARVTDAELAWLSSDEWFSRDAARSEPRLNRRRRSITSRRQDVITDFDGLVGPLDELDPLTRSTADGMRAQSGITSLEEFVQCGIRYFVTRVLGAGTDDRDPSEIVDIEPRDKGTLVHAVYERLLDEWLRANPRRDRPWIADRDELEQVLARAEEVLDDEAAPRLAAHRLGHPRMWRARRAQIVSALRRGLEAELGDGAVPLATELGFGSRHDAPPVVWQSPSDPSLQIHFSGAIDRLDRLADGTVRVMDLKTGSSAPYRTISDEQPLGADLDKLQLPFYGWAGGQATGEPVRRAAYRFVGRHDHHPDVELQLTPEVEVALHARIDEIARRIRGGDFSPGEVGQYGCEVCSPDGLGRDEMNVRLARWLAGQHNQSDTATAIDAEAATDLGPDGVLL